jgi:hypothetical protein
VTRILLAGAAAAAVAFVLIVAASAWRVAGGLEPDAVGISAVLLTVAVPLIIAPVAAGFAAGLVARRWLGLTGGIVGFVGGALLAVLPSADGTPVSDPPAIVFFAVLVTFGYASALLLARSRVPA